MTLTLYGIANCDTVKTARAWLEGRGISYAFHDYRKLGVDAGRLSAWAEVVGWEGVINRSGTTFRKLPEAAKAGLDREGAIALMVAQPSMIRRPVVERDGVVVVVVGFKEVEWGAVFQG